MKARAKPLALPSPLPDRYWVHESPKFGTLTFRHPFYGVGDAALRAIVGHKDRYPDAGRTMQEIVMSDAPLFALVIGATWWHPLHEIETPFPLQDLGYDALIAYGVAVCDELQEAGYDIIDLMDVQTVCANALNRRQSLTQIAITRASFSAAPQAGSTA